MKFEDELMNMLTFRWISIEGPSASAEPLSFFNTSVPQTSLTATNSIGNVVQLSGFKLALMY